MKWDDFRTSDNIEDRRGETSSSGTAMGSILGGGGKLGFGVIVLVFIISRLTGVDFSTLLGGAQVLTGGSSSYTQQQTPQLSAGAHHGAPNDQMGQFVSKVLAQTEDTWSKVLPAQKGIQYTDPTVVLYTGETASGCGSAQSAMGPFYCPNDRKVYLDMSFFNDMKARYGGGGDFAYAYVVAHEIGHHVQNLLGILPKVQQEMQASGQQQANGLSVRLELMADCLAGVWAANANQNWQILEPGDVDKALATAAAIGDDRLQEAARGTVVPDSFTHGSSAQRQKWLQTGLKSGQIDSCNTFQQ